MRPRKITAPRRQCGAALLLMLLILMVGAAFLFTGNAGRATKNIENDKQTYDALARAKEALLGYAATDPNRPGELPCPDFNNDGVLNLVTDFTGGAGAPCTTRVAGVVRPGWLPWRAFNLSDLRDGNGERLWYVVFNDFHAGDLAILNSDTVSTISVDGTANIVAIVFSPGPPQAGQNGRGGTNALTGVASYLDGTNNNGDLVYASAGTGINDRLVVITRDELMRAVERRILREAKTCLEAYAPGAPGNTKYPWAAQLSTLAPPDFTGDSGATFGRIPGNGLVSTVPDAAMPANWPAGCFTFSAGSFWNDWRELLFYQIAPGFQPGAGGACGACVTLDTNNAARVVILTPGSMFGAQARTSNVQKGTIGNYFEGTNDGVDLNYTNPPLTTTTNDQAICVDGNNACR